MLEMLAISGIWVAPLFDLFLFLIIVCGHGGEHKALLRLLYLSDTQFQ